MANIIVGLDLGKFATKAVVKDGMGVMQRCYLRTKVDNLSNVVCDLNKLSGDIVEYENVLYLVGNKAKGVDFEVGKAKMHHKIPMLTALAKLMDRLGIIDAVFDLYVGCPLNWYLNKYWREEFRAFIQGNGIVNLKVNRRPYKICINSIEVLPETSGYVYNDISKNKDRLVGVIDIGGLYVNGVIYDRMNPLGETVSLDTEGTFILQESVKTRLNICLKDANVQFDEMPEIIKNGFMIDGKPHELGNRIVKETFRGHIIKIFNELRLRNWSLDLMDIAFIGGGSLVLKDSIKEKMPHFEVSDTAIWDNVNGFYKYGERNNK